jgi:nicotinamide riboside kinase
MRVYFIGSHSTGKTTIARYVADKYKIPLLNEVARQVLAERELSMDKLRCDMNGVDSFQKEVFLRQIKEEKERDNFVSDRSFDNLAYAAQHASVLREVLSDKRLGSYLDRLRQKDSYLFFVRPSKSTMINDGVREQVEWEGIVAIDAMVKFMLEMWDLRYMCLSSPNMQERVRTIDAVLR